jgi:hypothetical protein
MSKLTKKQKRQITLQTVQQYIITDNIQTFRRSMIDTKVSNIRFDWDNMPQSQLDHLYDIYDEGESWDSLMYTTTQREVNGKLKTFKNRRLILSKSVKFAKTHKNIGVTGMYLAPSTTIKGLNTCKFAGKCAKGCIAYTGNMKFNGLTFSNRLKALFFHTERYLIEMLADLVELTEKLEDDKKVMVRLNGTSDINFTMVLDMQAFITDYPNILGFYDYTKRPVNLELDGIYHLTYSWSETSKIRQAKQFNRIAVVVSPKDVEWLQNDPLIGHLWSDGDKHDLRALDDTKLVYLKAKVALSLTDPDIGIDDDFIQTREQLHMLTVCMHPEQFPFNRDYVINECIRLGFYHMVDGLKFYTWDKETCLTHIDMTKRLNTEEEFSELEYNYLKTLVTGLFLEVTC